jgi:RimJ/RimL family protein N-acetyltransferase
LTITLRRLGADDAVAFQALRMKGATEAPGFFRFDPDDDWSASLDKVHERIDTMVVLGAFVEDALVGIGGVNPFQGAKLKHKWLLWGMYVDRPGLGLGQRIVHALSAEARNGGAASVQLTLMADNARARALYERCGFVVYGTEPASILRGDRFVDELLMWQKVR